MGASITRLASNLTSPYWCLQQNTLCSVKIRIPDRLIKCFKIPQNISLEFSRIFLMFEFLRQKILKLEIEAFFARKFKYLAGNAERTEYALLEIFFRNFQKMWKLEFRNVEFFQLMNPFISGFLLGSFRQEGNLSDSKCIITTFHLQTTAALYFPGFPIQFSASIFGVKITQYIADTHEVSLWPQPRTPLHTPCEDSWHAVLIVTREAFDLVGSVNQDSGSLNFSTVNDWFLPPLHTVEKS